MNTKTQAPSAPSQAAEPIKKVSFGKLAPKKASTKTEYPKLPANAEAERIAQRIVERNAQVEALTGALETDKAELRLLVAPFYFSHNHGQHTVPSSIAVEFTVTDDKGAPTDAEGEVLVAFQNRYPKLESEAQLRPILGDRLGEFFRQGFDLKISGDKIPAESAQELVNALQELFAKHNATGAIEVKEGIKPVADFHARRHVDLTPEENLAIEQVCPIAAQIKTKGRK